MNLSMKRKEYSTNQFRNPMTIHLITQFFPHAWHRELNGIQAEKKLKDQKIGVYLFREDAGRVYLSGINHLGHVEHAEFVYENQYWLGFQGGSFIAKHPQDLIHQCLHCNQEQCAYLTC